MLVYPNVCRCLLCGVRSFGLHLHHVGSAKAYSENRNTKSQCVLGVSIVKPPHLPLLYRQSSVFRCLCPYGRTVCRCRIASLHHEKRSKQVNKWACQLVDTVFQATSKCIAHRIDSHRIGLPLLIAMQKPTQKHSPHSRTHAMLRSANAALGASTFFDVLAELLNHDLLRAFWARPIILFI